MRLLLFSCLKSIRIPGKIPITKIPSICVNSRRKVNKKQAGNLERLSINSEKSLSQFPMVLNKMQPKSRIRDVWVLGIVYAYLVLCVFTSTPLQVLLAGKQTLPQQLFSITPKLLSVYAWLKCSRVFESFSIAYQNVQRLMKADSSFMFEIQIQ